MQRILASALFVAALIGAVAIVAAPHGIAARPHSVRVMTALAYVGAGYVCHQRPERSFHVDGLRLPVCARCTGLYLAAPFGVAGALLMRRRRGADDRADRWWRVAMVVAAVPTVISVGLEWIGGPGLPCNISRALTAVPLGATLAAVVGAAVLGHFGPGPAPRAARV